MTTGSRSANLIILQLLHTSEDPGEFLRLCWDQLFPEQKKQIFHFLYLAKQEKTFVQTLRMELQLPENTIPWAELFALLKKWNRLTPLTFQSLLPNNKDGEFLDFRVNTPELIDLWNKKKKKKIAEYEDRKKDLLRDLEFAKNQGLKEKRMDALNQLKKFFPNDKSVATALQSEREFKARHLYNKLSAKKENRIYTKKDSLTFSPEEIDAFFKTIKKQLKKNADYAYDFSLFFLEMDLPLLALKVIDLLKKKSQKMLWYDLQISIEGKQYARALNTAALLQKNKMTSDQSFSLLYYQALALYGLGNKNDAIRIIKGILRIRPQFKSASSLLLEWGIET